MEATIPKADVLSAAGLWGDTQFTDAAITLGGNTWKVHRWVICRQSDYFMKALEGAFKEAQNKTIVLVNQTFTANDIESMLRYLYTARLQEHHVKDPVKTFVVGSYFHIKSLRDAAIYRIKKGLESYIETGFWRNWRKLAVQFLTEFQGTEIEQALVQVTAFHARAIIHQPLVMWDELIAAHPSFANQVLKEAFPKPAEPQANMVKSSAFDDIRRAA